MFKDALLVALAAAATASTMMGYRWLAVALLVALASGAWILLHAVKRLEERLVWLEGTLDAVPQPITVTDLEMRWVYVNKTTEGLLKRTNQQVRGHRCSEWKADICGTDKCGIQSLRSGRPQTEYMQRMPDGSMRSMQVDTNYIHDRNGKPIGHVEIVTDMHSRYLVQTMHERLASSLEEISSSMTEMDAQTKATAENSSKASILSRQSRESLLDGNERMRELAAAMKAIGESSTKILRINKVIDEIAFQTNILALNAAVEAARAGAAGAGFAVVAEEVRSLSGRVSEASKETSELVSRSAVAVKQGRALAEKAVESMREIGEQTGKIDDLLGGIARASGEQSQGISAIREGLHGLEQATLGDRAVAPPARLVNIQVRR